MNPSKVLVIVGSLIVISVAVGGLYLIGPPSEQRLLSLDEQRMRDLRHLAYAIEQRWEDAQQLPDTLDGLIDGRHLDKLPLDPDTRQGYRYERTSKNSYRLCAVLARPSRSRDATDFWAHGAGEQCFDFSFPQPG